jgi:hypothetical protein
MMFFLQSVNLGYVEILGDEKSPLILTEWTDLFLWINFQPIAIDLDKFSTEPKMESYINIW